MTNSYYFETVREDDICAICKKKRMNHMFEEHKFSKWGV